MEFSLIQAERASRACGRKWPSFGAWDQNLTTQWHVRYGGRRFTRTNVQHPTYKALAELGKVIKTIFLCRYLHDENLRREIHEGLNVIEQWNGANDFVFFARRGELVSNRTEDHELTKHAGAASSAELHGLY